MEIGHFYFISNEYYDKFKDKNLQQNKKHTGRPCFFAFQDKFTGLYWIIPISHQIDKYKEIYNRRTTGGKRCDTIAFADVLGCERAFLIQNMCPIIEKYVIDEYINKDSKSAVAISTKDERRIIESANKILRLHRQGKNYIFPNVDKIELELLKEIA